MKNLYWVDPISLVVRPCTKDTRSAHILESVLVPANTPEDAKNYAIEFYGYDEYLRTRHTWNSKNLL